MLSTSRGAPRPGALRRLNAPRPVEVRAGGDGLPIALRRPPQAGWLAVSQELDRYRTDDRWWTAKPIARTYYELLLEDGRALTVFRDEIEGSWWEQRGG